MSKAHAQGLLLLSLGATVGLWACGCGGTCSKPGGPVAGAADAHCTGAQATSQASCHPTDAGVPDGGLVIDYGDTLYGTEGDDDDCKYHVKWSVSDVCESTDVTFDVTVTQKSDGAAVTGANPDLEVFLNDTHPAPNSGTATTENGGGKYTIGPVRFDASGRWTVRFHVFEDCEDLLADSPHGHAGFYLDVP